MSRDWEAERQASNRRVHDLQKEYARRLRRERGGRAASTFFRRAKAVFVIALIIAAVLLLPRLLSDAETATTDVRVRVEDTIEERTIELIEQVEDELGVELSSPDQDLRSDQVSLQGSGWALPLDIIDAERAGRPHHSYPAWDYGTAVGTPVYAMTASVVATATGDDGDRCGGTVRLTTEESGAEITYCHLSEVSVVRGDTLAAGDMIGFTGGKPGDPGAGRSSGPHLHLQIRLDGQLRCPQAQLLALGDDRELPVAQLPTDCFYVASGFADVGDSDDADLDEAWFVWD